VVAPVGGAVPVPVGLAGADAGARLRERPDGQVGRATPTSDQGGKRRLKECSRMSRSWGPPCSERTAAARAVRGLASIYTRSGWQDKGSRAAARYSARSASTGSRLAARRAGRTPLSRPTVKESARAATT